MSKLALFVVCSLTVTIGCHSGDHSGACAPIGKVTRVEVRISPHGTASPSDYSIDNTERIHHLIEFANARREVFQPSLYTMPAPEVTAGFYDQRNFVGAIGAGSNFLFVSCASWKGIRNSTDTEVGEFKKLVESPR